MTQQTSLVRRLIAFLRKPDALDYTEREPVSNVYDDFEPRDPYHTHHSHASDRSGNPYHAYAASPVFGAGEEPNHSRASRLDALIMRAVQQFHAYNGFVLRYDNSGQMSYCTGRDLSGRYVPYTDVKPDRRAVYMTLDSGEAQLFIQQNNNMPVTVLCGPLRDGNDVIGVLYLYSPVRSKVHRGIFDVFCSQASRLLNDGLA